jgi:hypothetical protein
MVVLAVISGLRRAWTVAYTGMYTMFHVPGYADRCGALLAVIRRPERAWIVVYTGMCRTIHALGDDDRRTGFLAVILGVTASPRA